MQDGGQCVGGNDVESYKKYGRSDACKSGGKGGPYANQVYGINRKWNLIYIVSLVLNPIKFV